MQSVITHNCILRAVINEVTRTDMYIRSVLFITAIVSESSVNKVC